MKFIAVRSNKGAFGCAKAIREGRRTATQYVPSLKVISITAPDNLAPDDLLRSDHAYFWRDTIPALMLTDGADFRNPHYHRSSDTLGTLNFTFMSRVVKAVVATAAELAGPQHSTEATALNVVVGCLLAINGLEVADGQEPTTNNCLSSGQLLVPLQAAGGFGLLFRSSGLLF